MAQVHHTIDAICSNGGRAEQSSKVVGFGFVDAQIRHEVDEICSNGGRAEQSTKVIGFGFVDAHVPLTLYYVSTRVDVPRFELGASTMPR